MVAESVTSRQNESRSLLAVDIQGHQRGGFCIAPWNEIGLRPVSVLPFGLNYYIFVAFASIHFVICVACKGGSKHTFAANHSGHTKDSK